MVGDRFNSLLVSTRRAPETIMTGENSASCDDGDRLIELQYMTAAVGHHVINAYSAIVSNAELIRSGAVDAGDLEMLGGAIVEAALNASQVSRRLIDWSRRPPALRRDQPAPEPPLVDLNQLIRETVESQTSQATSRVHCTLDLGSIPPIAGDSKRLATMLGHLLRNACEASEKAAGTILISTSIDSRDWLVVAIRDTGCGMSTDVLKRATEPFFSTKEDHDGIGLTIAQGIWRRHRGGLSIESQPGQGTTIRLTIGPVAALPSADAASSPIGQSS
jgi:signal transduction histidine kinase